MTLAELKDRIDWYMDQSIHNGELEVCIPNQEGGMEGTPVTYVKSAHKGIDWDSGKFIIHPVTNMIEQPEQENS